MFIRWLILAGCLVLVRVGQAEDSLSDRYYRAVFSADLSWVSGAVPSTTADEALLTRFRERFLERRGTEAMNAIDDSLVRDVASAFVTYWIDSLLDPTSRERHETALERAVGAALDRHGEAFEPPALERIESVIRQRGWGFQGGRTQPLLDFILWRTTETREYDVELSDRTQRVTVHFLSDFVSQGWSHFATFGHAGTGGWAGEHALYCVKDQYSLDSERFRVSYLKHEARHYADYQLHPGLEQVDLEYRAKLTELAFAEHSQRQLLNRFMAHADRDARAPHPLANWRVISALAEQLHLDRVPRDSGDWQPIMGDPIRLAARALLAMDDDGRTSNQ